MKRLWLLLLALFPAGCLEEPGVEELWTRLDVIEPAQGDSVSLGDTTFTFTGRITYRRILTGSIIAELRVSDVIGPQDVNLSPDAPREEVLADIETILSNSVVLGGDAFLVTGWDHLQHTFTLSFDTEIPDARGVFLILYFGDVEEVELPSGEEIEIFHPAQFEEEQILPTGVELDVATGGGTGGE